MPLTTTHLRRALAITALAGTTTLLAATAGNAVASTKQAAHDGRHRSHTTHTTRHARGGHGHGSDHGPHQPAALPADVTLLTPAAGDRAGIGSKGWFVDLKVRFATPLAATGFTAEQLTGPAAHNNVAPFPGTFSAGQDDRFPGLIVLASTTQTTNPDGTPTNLAGPGQNLANLFNITGVTNRTRTTTEISDGWIVGAPLFGHNTASTIYAAIAADKNHDGIYNDAPAVVPDANHDGRVDAKDLAAFGLASRVAAVPFTIID